MQLISLLILLIVCNWIFSETLVLLPIHFLLNALNHLMGYGLAILVIGVIAWCFGE